MFSANPNRLRAFSLIELLAVIAIIGVLAAIVLATLSRVRASAHATTCLSNLRQIGQAALQWSGENQGYMVPCDQGANGVAWWPSLLAPYLNTVFAFNDSGKQPEIYRCMSSVPDFSESEKGAYFVSYRANIAGASKGANAYHPKYTMLKLAAVGNPAGFPLIVDGAPRQPNNWRGWFGTSQGDKGLLGFYHGDKASRVFLELGPTILPSFCNGPSSGRSSHCPPGTAAREP